MAAREVFLKLGQAFSQAASGDTDLIAAEGSGNLAYTVHPELTSRFVFTESRGYVLRVNQVYRHEDGGWEVVHRHADNEPGPDVGSWANTGRGPLRDRAPRSGYSALSR